MRGRQKNKRRVGHGVGAPGEAGSTYPALEGYRARWPMRGDSTLRSVGGDTDLAQESEALLHKVRIAKDVVVNTVESVYPWMGLTVGVLLRKNPIVRVLAPLAGLTVGVVRAMTHTEDKHVAAVVTEVIANEPVEVPQEG